MTTSDALGLSTPDYRRRTFGARHRRVLRALAEALFSEDGDAPPARLDALVDEVDQLVSPASKTLRFGLRIMLEVLSVWPLVSLFRPATFEGLSTPDRVTLLKRMDRSRIPQVTLILAGYKTMMTMLFYEEAEELAKLGYPGPERVRWKRGLPVLGPKAEAPRDGSLLPDAPAAEAAARAARREPA